MTAALADALRTLTSLDRAIAQAGALDDPALEGVADPAGRFRIEALQSSVRDARSVAAEEIGAAQGVAEGFDSADCD